MKLQTIRPVRSLCLETIFTPTRNKTRRGMHPFKSKLEQITGESRGYDPRTFNYNPLTKRDEIFDPNKRITLVKTKGKNRFHAVGLGEFKGTFAELKETMRSNGFSGYRFCGKVCQLN